MSDPVLPAAVPSPSAPDVASAVVGLYARPVEPPPLPMAMDDKKDPLDIVLDELEFDFDFEDGKLVSAVRLVQKLAGLDYHDKKTAQRVISDLSKGRKTGDVAARILKRRRLFKDFDTPTWAITFAEANKLIDIMPDTSAVKAIKEWRLHTSQKVKAGAQDLHDEIDRNALSNGTASSLARSGLGISDAIRISVPIDDSAMGENLDLKRKRIELETDEMVVVKAKAMLQVEVEKQEIANETQRIANETARFELEQKKKAAGYTQVVPKAVAAPAGSKSPKEVSIKDVILKLKQPFNMEDCKAIGALAAIAFKKKHGRPPPKSKRVVDGYYIPNRYTEADWPLLLEVGRGYYARKQTAAARGGR